MKEGVVVTQLSSKAGIKILQFVWVKTTFCVMSDMYQKIGTENSYYDFRLLSLSNMHITMGKCIIKHWLLFRHKKQPIYPNITVDQHIRCLRHSQLATHKV